MEICMTDPTVIISPGMKAAILEIVREAIAADREEQKKRAEYHQARMLQSFDVACLPVRLAGAKRPEPADLIAAGDMAVPGKVTVNPEYAGDGSSALEVRLPSEEERREVLRRDLLYIKLRG
jgi:hypothetical protein